MNIFANLTRLLSGSGWTRRPPSSDGAASSWGMAWSGAYGASGHPGSELISPIHHEPAPAPAPALSTHGLDHAQAKAIESAKPASLAGMLLSRQASLGGSRDSEAERQFIAEQLTLSGRSGLPPHGINFSTRETVARAAGLFIAAGWAPSHLDDLAFRALRQDNAGCVDALAARGFGFWPSQSILSRSWLGLAIASAPACATRMIEADGAAFVSRIAASKKELSELLALAEGDGFAGILRSLLALGLPPNAISDQGESILTTHARQAAPTAIAIALDFGADPNLANAHGDFPLHLVLRHAADAQGRPAKERRGDPDGAIAALLAAGADPFLPNALGVDARQWAALLGRLDVQRACAAQAQARQDAMALEEGFRRADAALAKATREAFERGASMAEADGSPIDFDTLSRGAAKPARPRPRL